MTAEFSPKKYADLLVAALPQIIESEAEYARMLAIVEPMMSREDTLLPEEAKLFDLLVKLIQDYEEEHYPIEPAPPAQVLQHLLEVRGLVEEDIVPLFVSREEMAAVMQGEQAIHPQQAQKLAKFFHVSSELFL